MSEQALEPLASDVAELLRMEQAAPEPAVAWRQHIWSGLEPALIAVVPASIPVPRASPGAAMASSRVAMATLAFAMGAGTATVYHRMTADSETTRQSRAPVAPQTTPVLEAPEKPLPREPKIPSPPRPAARLPSEVKPVMSDDNLAQERQWIEQARSALARSAPERVLEATEAHARRFPNGQLAEEREALAIQALRALHKDPEVRARGEAFRRQFPGSMLLPLIDEVLQDGLRKEK